MQARIDTIEALGRTSLSGRNRRMHHYLRGRLLEARGQREAAIAELRRAMWSWGFGYTRINATLADLLMKQGRPREAISLLQPALRGPIEASNYYMSRTEIHEALAKAWDAVGGRDSAIVHYELVSRGWSRADSQFTSRATLARDRVQALRAPR
jgi:tetratricopeptide (TPR) repeat protein